MRLNSRAIALDLKFALCDEEITLVREAFVAPNYRAGNRVYHCFFVGGTYIVQLSGLTPAVRDQGWLPSAVQLRFGVGEKLGCRVNYANCIREVK
jgi:hypothetical protein